jgi:hypothetical protein
MGPLKKFRTPFNLGLILLETRRIESTDASCAAAKLHDRESLALDTETPAASRRSISTLYESPLRTWEGSHVTTIPLVKNADEEMISRLTFKRSPGLTFAPSALQHIIELRGIRCLDLNYY